MADGCLAGAAGEAFAAIDREALFKIAGLAIGFYEIAEGGAALGDGFLQDLTDGGDEAGGFGLGDFAGGEEGMDFTAEEAFGSVDIADAYDGGGVHEGYFDGDIASFEGFVEVLGGKRLAEGLRAELAEERMGGNF